MKSVVKAFLTMIFSFGLFYTLHAQGIQDNKLVTTIRQYHIELSDNKTTNIIFPYSVKSVDRGSSDLIAQVVQGFGNVLQIKANVANFQQTNVTVITSDGKFYSFLADYNSDPKVLNLTFARRNNKNGDSARCIALADNDNNEATLSTDAASVLSAKPFLHQHIVDEKMKFRLAGIYLKDGLMWFKLSLSNQSQVAFNVDDISFSTTDKKQVSRTARQEILLQVVYKKSVEAVNSNANDAIVLAFKPFTFSNDKRLKIQISERAGGRNLILSIKPTKLLRARACDNR